MTTMSPVMRARCRAWLGERRFTDDGDPIDVVEALLGLVEAEANAAAGPGDFEDYLVAALLGACFAGPLGGGAAGLVASFRAGWAAGLVALLAGLCLGAACGAAGGALAMWRFERHYGATMRGGAGEVDPIS
jgi:hypothetical protein